MRRNINNCTIESNGDVNSKVLYAIAMLLTFLIIFTSLAIAPLQSNAAESTTAAVVTPPAAPSLNYSEVNMFPGQKLTLKLNAGGFNIVSVKFDSDDDKLAAVDDKGVITATTNTKYIDGSSDTYICVTYTYKVGESTFVRNLICDVTVTEPAGIDYSTQSLSIKAKRTLEYDPGTTYTATKIKWASGRTKIATINQKGVVKGKKKGTAVIGIIFKCGKSSYMIKSSMPITKPVFKKKKYAVNFYSYTYHDIADYIDGITEFSKITNLKSSNKRKIAVDKDTNTFIVKKLGGYVTLSCKVDGRLIKAKFYSTAGRIVGSAYNGYSYTHYYAPKPVALKTGRTHTIKLEGTKSFSTYSFKSENTKIATVSRKGKVRAGHTTGATYIDVMIDGHIYKLHIVVSPDQRIVDVVNRASSAIGCVYSQARRMERGYYDCSSLVWRCYSPSGETFGMPTWAPTADFEAQRMATAGKMIAWDGGLSPKKLKPGDIIFFKGYKDYYWRTIGHVAIYIGDDTIIHASGGMFGVFESNYTERRPRVSCIARPF